ncbi:uncharacterized protein LOC107874089 [Capsicum annuum]|uniref:uncharacterized protein LOC107874089 n=1 Tax=Capsicum annuum TaxID=4072 RepID=UPI001FB1072C|nr:uncharacterized protein LOC107874089 [Capsicum annuum]
MVQGTTEHGYSFLLAFSYMIDAFNVGTTYSIMDTENHIYPIAFCVVDKENDASWTFFFEKLKSIVVDGPDLCFISDRHKSIANGIAKAYSPEEFTDHFVEFKNYYPEVAFFLEHEFGFEKWSRAYFPSNRFDVMTTNIVESVNTILIDEREYPVASIFNLIAKRFVEIFRERRACVLKCKDNKFVPTAEKILRDNISEGDSFYVENISGDERQYTVFGSGCTAKVDLLERSCFCRKFDLFKIPYDHAMIAL